MNIRRIGAVLGAAAAVLVIVFIAAKILLRPVPSMTFTAEGNALIVNGETGGTSLADLEGALAAHPNTRTLILDRIEGSNDDTVNLAMARTVRARNLDTHLNNDSVIELGGIELFIGGVHRTMEDGARIGVHSWYDDDGHYEGRDLPRDHPDHKPYLETYRGLGVTDDLYWFILDAASNKDMYFMTNEEIERFGVLTAPIGED